MQSSLGTNKTPQEG